MTTQAVVCHFTSTGLHVLGFTVASEVWPPRRQKSGFKNLTMKLLQLMYNDKDWEINYTSHSRYSRFSRPLIIFRLKPGSAL